MKNTVENDIFWIFQVNWLNLTGKVNKSVRFYVKISQDLLYQK